MDFFWSFWCFFWKNMLSPKSHRFPRHSGMWMILHQTITIFGVNWKFADCVLWSFIVCIGVSTPLSTPLPPAPLFRQVPFKSANCPSPLSQATPLLPPPRPTWNMLSFASDKAEFVAEIVSENSYFGDSGIFMPAFPFRSSLKLHDNPVTSKIVKGCWFITDVDSSKASGTYIPKVVLNNSEFEFSCILADFWDAFKGIVFYKLLESLICDTCAWRCQRKVCS